MTLDEFVKVLDQGIPTPAEFVAFAEGMRWKFKVDGDKAALVANARDPLALAFAKVLSREPYRSNVMALLRKVGDSLDCPEPKPVPAPVVKAPEVVTCKVCSKDVSDPETRERMADPLWCERYGSKEVTDGRGIYHPATERCPYKPTS